MKAKKDVESDNLSKDFIDFEFDEDLFETSLQDLDEYGKDIEQKLKISPTEY